MHRSSESSTEEYAENPAAVTSGNRKQSSEEEQGIVLHSLMATDGLLFPRNQSHYHLSILEL